MVTSPGASSSATGPSHLRTALRVLYFLALLYLFFLSIELMSSAFKMAGRGFAEQLIHTVSDPLAALLLGFVATGIIQSSSTTTTSSSAWWRREHWTFGWRCPSSWGPTSGRPPQPSWCPSDT